MRVHSLIIFMLICFSSTAQVAFKEFNINSSGDAYPARFTLVNGKLFFSATTADGNELWATDGTIANTQQVANINAGAASSTPKWLTALGTKLLFCATDGIKGEELWESDGTIGGTKLLKDMYLGVITSNPENLKAFNGKVYFNAFGSNGAFSELWSSDGTEAGTTMLKDINPTGGSFAADFCEYNSKLYFRATTDNDGEELWMTDGSDTSTKMLKNIGPGAVGSYPNSFITAGGKLFFVASLPGINNTKIYVTDGTAPNTVAINALPVSGTNFYIVYNNELYVNAGVGDMELWKTDGTVSGTKLVSDITTGSLSTTLSWPVVYNNKIYFAAMTAGDNELWESDGTAAGTKLVKDIVSGASSSNPAHLKVYKNKLYFAAEHTPGDTQLFVSDGTAAGTKVLLNPSATIANPLSAKAFNGFTEYNDELYFAAKYTSSGYEMWSLKDTTTLPNGIQITTKPNTAMFTISPNPSGGMCNVQLQNTDFASGLLSVADMTGKSVYTTALKRGIAKYILDMQNLPSGVYIISANADGIVGYNKLIVHH